MTPATLRRFLRLADHLPDASRLARRNSEDAAIDLEWQAQEVYEAVPDIIKAAIENTAAALALAGGVVNIDALVCPLCGTSVKWSCGVGEHPTGHAHCEMGGHVSRRVGTGPVCLWSGTRLVRIAGTVVAPLPISRGIAGDPPARDGEAAIRRALRLPPDAPWPDVLARAEHLAGHLAEEVDGV